MITTSVEQIKDYQICARLYDYRHANTIYEPQTNRELLNIRYENVLKNVLTFFFHKKQSGTQPTFDFLVKKWEKLWFPKDMTVQQIMTASHADTHNFSVEEASVIGVRALKNIYEYFDDKSPIPLLVQEPYIVPLIPNMRLEGTFDLVLKYKDYDHVIKWNASITKASMSNLILDFAALRYSYEYRRGQKYINPIKYSLIDLASPKMIIKDFEAPDEDIDSLKYWGDAIARDEIFMPRRGLTVHCNSCAFDSPCSKFRVGQTNE